MSPPSGVHVYLQHQPPQTVPLENFRLGTRSRIIRLLPHFAQTPSSLPAEQFAERSVPLCREVWDTPPVRRKPSHLLASRPPKASTVAAKCVDAVGRVSGRCPFTLHSGLRWAAPTSNSVTNTMSLGRRSALRMARTSLPRDIAITQATPAAEE